MSDQKIKMVVVISGISKGYYFNHCLRHSQLCHNVAFHKTETAGMLTDVYWVRLVHDSNMQCSLFPNLNKTLNKLSTTMYNAEAIRVTVLFFALPKISERFLP